MKKFIIIIKFFFLFWIISILTGCMTFHESPLTSNKKSETVHSDDNNTDNNITLKKNPELQKIYETHEITVFPAEIGDKFVNLYILTRKKEYLPKGNRTFCVKFFYDYFIDIGYGEVLEEIKNTGGKNMVEKAIRYAEQTGKIKVLLSGFEAQKLANQGRDVGVLGEYYYDHAEKYYTVHYSVVQPSNVSYDEQGKVVPYYVTGLLTKRKNVNERYGTGTFLAQAGIAVGLIDFRWAYNRKMNGIIQKDSKGNFRGGIIFIVFPEKAGEDAGVLNLQEDSLSTKPEPKEASEFVYGSLDIITLPPEADVFINGIHAGKSPCRIPDLSPGDVAISLRIPGYLSVSRHITIEPEKEVNLNIELNQYKMVKVIGKEFTPAGRESTLLKDFFISTYEVTCEQYEEYCVQTGAIWQFKGTMYDRDFPVTFIDWYEAIEYCNWRSTREGYRPYYEIKKDTTDSKMWKVIRNPDADGYRLPTVLEWEYAAKGGGQSQGYIYSGGNELPEVAWYNENSNKQIHGVGQKKPNEIGLSDMTGNAWEWCWDSYNGASDVPLTNEDSNTNTTATGTYRVRKGGSAYNSNTIKDPFEIESIQYLEPNERNSFTGFRIVRQDSLK